MLINYGSCIVFLNNAEYYILTVISDTAGADIYLDAPGYTQIGNQIRVPKNTAVECTIYKPGYVPKTQIVTVTENQTIHMSVTEPGVLFTIIPMPADATITIIIDGYPYNIDSIEVPINREFSYRVAKENYKTVNNTLTITEATTINVELEPDIPSTDYEYTVQGDDTAILTKYIGTNPVVIGPDSVEGDL